MDHSSSAPYYRPDIDGMRSVAVLAVVAFHVFPRSVPGGFIGVDVFFVISGYLITRGLLTEGLSGKIAIGDFYARRIRRIFPALAIVLFACLVAGWLMMPAIEFRRFGTHLSAGGASVANLLFWRQVNYFDPDALSKPLLHLWSLGVEEQFYAVWPFAICLLVRQRLNIRVAFAGLIVASFTYCVWLTQSDPPAAFYSPLSRFWQLACGGLLATVALRDARRHDLLSAAGLALVCGSAVLFTPSNVPGWQSAGPVAGAVMLIAAGPRSWANRLLSAANFVSIGRVSYPLYLWHWPLLSFAYLANDMAFPDRAARVAVVALSFALAIATYRLVETPLRRMPAAAPAGAVSGLVLFGLMIVALDGVPARSANHDPRRTIVSKYLEMASQSDHAWRQECNFYDWHSNQAKAGIDASCTRSKYRAFIWGDSHAQAIAVGLRGVGGKLNQVATSQCAPDIPRPNASLNGPLQVACERSRGFALKAIRTLQPRVVYLAQRSTHEATDWASLASSLRKMGVHTVVLIGPSPQWLPSLPAIVMRDPATVKSGFVSEGLDPTILRTDRILAARYGKSHDLTYVSLIQRLCSSNGCKPVVNGAFLVSDYGHFTAQGASLAAAIVMQRAASDRGQSDL